LLGYCLPIDQGFLARQQFLDQRPDSTTVRAFTFCKDVFAFPGYAKPLSAFTISIVGPGQGILQAGIFRV
jgi:hypothetical protein